MWLLLGFGAWLGSMLALLGVLGVSTRESRREETLVRARHLSVVRRVRRRLPRS